MTGDGLPISSPVISELGDFMQQACSISNSIANTLSLQQVLIHVAASLVINCSIHWPAMQLACPLINTLSLFKLNSNQFTLENYYSF